MILPSGEFDYVIPKFLQGNYQFLGCLSPEQRCTTIPSILINDSCTRAFMIEINDPKDAFPNHSVVAKINTTKCETRLKPIMSKYQKMEMDLLANEDQLIESLSGFYATQDSSTFILDITSFPKRYFCFLIKRLLLAQWKNVLVTYTEATEYPEGHLSEDPMSSDYLPGFGTIGSSNKADLVVTIGFESHGIRSIVEQFAHKPIQTKYILSFPPDGKFLKRQWLTLMQLLSGNSERAKTENVVSIATWDSQEVYFALEYWIQQANQIVCAPFGAKPHTLGMTLFSIEHNCPMIYSQPKSYNPSYTLNEGRKWAYVIKWDGVSCYDRKRIMP